MCNILMYISIQHGPSTLPMHNVYPEVICVVISDEESVQQVTFQQMYLGLHTHEFRQQQI